MAQLVGPRGSPEPFPLRSNSGRSIPSEETEVFAAEYDNNLCLICGYCPRYPPAKHIGPECGEPYDIAIVKKTWKQCFEAQRAKK